MEDTTGRESPMLHLDLYNFESAEAEGSRYVLTSPRSLEACARHDIRPVVLLHKPLTEFQEEHPETPLRLVTELFEIHEKERRRNLRLCREERQKIVEEEKCRRTPIPTTVSAWSPRVVAAIDNGDKTLEDHFDAGESPVPFDASPPRARALTWGYLSEVNKSVSEINRKGDALNVSVQTAPPKSVSISDLSHSPATEKTVNKLARQIARETNVSVPEKDRKIAALMLAKHEEEKSFLEQKLKAQKRWDEIKHKDRQQKMQLERERRLCLSKNNEKWERDLKLRKLKIFLEEKQISDVREKILTQNDAKWRELARNQEKRRIENRERAKYEADLKKRTQEQSLKEKEATNETAREYLNQSLQEKMSKATQNRLLKEMKTHRRMQVENEHEKLKNEVLRKEINNRTKTDELLRKMALEQRLNRSQEYHQQITKEKIKELKEKAVREDEQILKARLRAEEHQQQQMRYREALAQVTDKKIQQAREAAIKNIQQKAHQVKKINTEKEKLHQLKKEKVEEEEQFHRLETQEVIRSKDKKSEKIMKEKEIKVVESKRRARASFQMREKVREKINTRSFDQMAREAQLRASLIKVN
ncbi:coiled-coil domain-containing protein 177-like [Protopterus annectens]|uniref:coiled-coil domain-containing protein 177-like n=1 Tax=Protopterus annectens TaxID=7888 RepID=UPI001CFB079A|nr:coiled-coil domain-containing protein 177-like [Protopterus annectens]